MDEVKNLFRHSKKVVDSIESRIANGVPWNPLIGLDLPDREIVDPMVDMYIQSFESTYRVLHIPTLRTEYKRFWSDPNTVAIDLKFRVLLCAAIGSVLSEQNVHNRQFYQLACSWVFAAQDWLCRATRKETLSIAGIQVQCLIVLARQVLSVESDIAWISTGSLMNTAMQMGLHRDPKHFSTMSVLECELRRRLWATIVEMTVQSSLDAVLPTRISLQDFDVEPPSNIDGEECDDQTLELRVYPKEIHTTSSVQLMLLESMPTRFAILELLNGLKSTISYMQVLDFSKKLIDAWRSGGQFLRRNSHAGVTAFVQNLFHYLIRRFMMPLHCSFMIKARAEPMFHYSLKSGLDTALAMIIPPIEDESFIRLISVGGGLFRETSRLATTIIGLELIAHTNARNLDGLSAQHDMHGKHLKNALHTVMAFTLQRLQAGRTNISSHVFTNMIIGCAEAIEKDLPQDMEIMNHALDSLKTCGNILEECLRGSLATSGEQQAYLASTIGEVDLSLDSDLAFLRSIDYEVDLETMIPSLLF